MIDGRPLVQGELLLIRMAKHLPVGLVMGTPLVADGQLILTSDGIYELDDDGSVSRLRMWDGRAELTRWTNGREILRVVGEGRAE